MRTIRNTSLALLLFLFLPSSLLALETGVTAPDFKLPTLDGKEVQLSDYKGRIIVLKLATTWCPTCKQQSQEIRDIAPFLKENNIAVLEVFLQDSEKMVREHLKDHESSMPHVALLDNGQARKAYNVYLIPRLLVIDRDFKIRHDGSLITGYDLKRLIQQINGSAKQ